MRRRRVPQRWLFVAGIVGFVVGVIVTVSMRQGLSDERALTGDPEAADEEVAVRPSRKETPPPVTPPPKSDAVPAISADPIADLRAQRLTLPVKGISREDLRSSFDEMRGARRRHEAIDVLAPRNTPVVAVEDGTIAKLFLSEAGGITIYQVDPTERYVYYYAHLEAYAPGLREGDQVTRGEVIGYVGTTGNAPRETPHLHFAIFRMTDEKRWWQGTPIDPYLVLR